MISRPYSPNVPDSDFEAAYAWWRNLSINQSKALMRTHFPTWLSSPHKLKIHQMWEEEGKPEPQALIPVEPYVNPNRVSPNGVLLPD